jgi:hypothetical protein
MLLLVTVSGVWRGEVYRQESNLAPLPQSQKLFIDFFGILLLMKRKEISSSAPGLSMMTLRECRVDRPFQVT